MPPEQARQFEQNQVQARAQEGGYANSFGSIVLPAKVGARVIGVRR